MAQQGVRKVALYRDEGGVLHKLSAICPHSEAGRMHVPGMRWVVGLGGWVRGSLACAWDGHVS